jgi:hypothetical protein
MAPIRASCRWRASSKKRAAGAQAVKKGRWRASSKKAVGAQAVKGRWRASRKKGAPARKQLMGPWQGWQAGPQGGRPATNRQEKAYLARAREGLVPGRAYAQAAVWRKAAQGGSGRGPALLRRPTAIDAIIGPRDRGGRLAGQEGGNRRHFFCHHKATRGLTCKRPTLRLL